MSGKNKTSQEEFWMGEFGDNYCARNAGANCEASNMSLFSTILKHVKSCVSVIELGANVGVNLIAISKLLPDAELSAVEINRKAVSELTKIKQIREVFHDSILSFETDKVWDIVLVKGVLIHINPDFLKSVYKTIYQSSGRYIVLAEYYHPTPVEVKYRGYSGKLFKRDFAGEMLDLFEDLEIVDYGFVWRRDPNFPQDDLTWFLLEKKKNC